MKKFRTVSGSAALCAFSVLAFSDGAAAATPGVNVTTYHYDNYRTGWNQNETVLTPAAVRGPTFKMTSFTALDDQVDTQPLIMTGQTIDGHGVHDVVYVTTESDTVYAIDADSGEILKSRTLGTAVPNSSFGYCGNNGANVGIDGTPVIDAANGVMYVIAYNIRNNVPFYRLHELNLASLGDAVPPVLITAAATLTNGKTYKFDPYWSRQRPALLLANGNVYAGFGSFCDFTANKSRGWVLGWQAGSMTPLAADQLNNKLAKDPDTFFLSAVWMSGYGLAASPSGDVYFVTGNSDPSGTTIDGVNNIAESTVQISSDLTTVKSLFTPSDAGTLDQGDTDFGSGGALLLPAQSGQLTNLLVAAGKDGNLYVLDADNLGTGAAGASAPFGSVNIGGCWCGQSYYTASDGEGRVVSSGGNNVDVWRVKTGPNPKLVLVKSSAGISGAQDPGFFTAVSTNGTTAHTGVIWAVGRADGTAAENVSLNAFDADTGATLFTGNAGTWPNTGGNANIAPVVANGKVYVASYEGLAIYGLSSASPAKLPVQSSSVARAPLPSGMHELYGTVRSINGSMLVVETRTGKTVTVDDSKAREEFHMAEPSVGNAVLARGSIDTGGVMHAAWLLHAKNRPTMWPSDR
jgi:hypothetical protein